jgi:hypothetical protein
MTDPEDHDLERPLATLFERSAASPSDAERARLLGHARAVGKSGRGARARLVWGPALAAAAAVAYLVAAPPHGRKPEAASGPGSASAPAGDGVGLPRPVASTEAAVEPVESEDPVAAVLGAEDGELDLGPLMGGGVPSNTEGSTGMGKQDPWTNQKTEGSP